ncbi:larval cuticle protein a2b [Lasius niger]|uniref:Larval cuticle protein a2b n=1 Tax=Lasius niger TaxID=67767 RepID=A0A0J7L677_LASNI|nr:larval cuticle protein a2b [Lasius niger]
MCKSELLKMYKQVAMPLPQRQCGNAKNLDTEINMIPDKSVTAISSNDTHSLAADLNKGSKRTCQLSQTDRLKLPVNDPKSVHKKIRLCSTSVETTWNGISKRRCDEQNESVIVLSAAVLAVCRSAAVPSPALPAVPAVPAAAFPVAKLGIDDASFDPYPQYSYAYDVQDTLTGDTKSQHESRNGDVVSGSYSLLEADGTRRIVEYIADPVNGFNAVLFFFLGLTALARGALVPAGRLVLPATAPLAKLEDFDAAPQYSFAYDVQDAVTGDSKAQYETRNGDIVRGSYSLIEADGTRRIVEYTADPINGFNAIVSREPAIAAVATPLRPAAALTPIAPAPLGPAALAPIAPPSIPASGPDSDVEVLEARTSRLSTSAGATTREREIQRQQFQRLQEQQQQRQQQQLQQQEQQLQRLQEQQRRSSSRLQIQQQEQQQQQQQQDRQQATAPTRTIIAGQEQQQPTARFIGLPARAIATYPTYPYSAAYSSPFAYAAPLTGLAYNPATALA